MSDWSQVDAYLAWREPAQTNHNDETTTDAPAMREEHLDGITDKPAAKDSDLQTPIVRGLVRLRRHCCKVGGRERVRHADEPL